MRNLQLVFLFFSIHCNRMQSANSARIFVAFGGFFHFECKYFPPAAVALMRRVESAHFEHRIYILYFCTVHSYALYSYFKSNAVLEGHRMCWRECHNSQHRQRLRAFSIGFVRDSSLRQTISMIRFTIYHSLLFKSNGRVFRSTPLAGTQKFDRDLISFVYRKLYSYEFLCLQAPDFCSISYW